MEDVGYRIVSAVTVLGAMGRLRHGRGNDGRLGRTRGTGLWRRCCKAVRVRSASQSKRGELAPPTEQALGT